MRLKDYLRGLGIGMIVVVLILSIGGRDRTMTDEEIIARARQLGMVDGNQTLINIQDKESTATEEENTKLDFTEENHEGSIAVESVAGTVDEPEKGESPESTETDEQEVNIENSKAEETVEETAQESTEEGASDSSKAPADNGTVIITVQRGDSSVSVSRDLAAAGAVESAKDFDKYLCENGYDKRISVGTFEIPVGASYEEMAKIITKSK
ncbi:MAG: hypothetical protein IJ335_02185 [Lachnospiraceae bacterium]|nr:hypothetical protein [Lachnospiraceae bacterium]